MLNLTEAIFAMLVERDDIDATNVVQHLRMSKQKIADALGVPVLSVDFERMRDMDEIDDIIIRADV